MLIFATAGCNTSNSGKNPRPQQAGIQPVLLLLTITPERHKTAMRVISSLPIFQQAVSLTEAL
jgi:hypothetical protein